jgi:hypothetical protein
MAIKPFNSVAGFSVGETPANIILANGDITTTNITTTGVSNLNSIGNVKITGGTGGQVISTDGAGNLSFITIGTASLNNGTSNVSVLNSGNILFSVAGNANVVTITGTGMNVAGTLNTGTGNANVGNLAATQLFATANVTAPQFVSNTTTGTAPFVVSSNTVVANLNADLLDGYNTATANTANTVAVRDASGNLAANYFIGDGSQLTGIDTSLISNGNSNVAVSGNSNVTVSVAGNANVVTFTGTGANINGYITVNGNAQFNNANLGNLATANFVNVSTNVNVTGTMQAGNVRTDNLLYANGNPWDLQQPAGANNEIQYNDNGSFGASANFTFNPSTNLLTVTGNGQFNNANLGNLATANFVNVASNTITNNLTVNLALAGNTANFSGNIVAGNISTSGSGGNISGANVISANTFSGTTANVTTVNANVLQNGNSNVAISGNSNVTVAANNINVLTISGYAGNAANNITNIAGQLGVSGNVTAPNFIGNVVGNISGNIVIPGSNTGVVFNDDGNANSTLGFTFNKTSNAVTANGNLTVNNANLGNLATANYVNTAEIYNGNSNVRITSNGNVTVSAIGSADVLTVSNLGANVIGYVSANGNGTFGAIKSNSVTAQGGNLELYSAQTGNTYIQLRPFGDGTVDVGNTRITSLATPNAQSDAATKQYVDDVAQGLNIHDAALAATSNTLANLTGGVITYNNGSSGVGANLVLSGSPTANYLSANVFDGNVTAVTNSRILVKSEANAAFNGVYVVSNATVLTRAADYNTVPEVEAGDFIFVQDGDTYNDSGWVQTTAVTTIGTDPILFTQFSGAGTYQAGQGLTLTGTVFSVNTDGLTTEISGGNVIVKANAQFTTPNIGAATGTSVNLTGNVLAGNVNSNALITAANIDVTSTVIANNFSANSNVTANNATINLALSGNTANFTGNIVALNTNAGNLLTANFANIASNVTASNLTVNLALSGNTANFSGNVFAPAIVQNASTYDTRVSLSSGAGIVQITSNGNSTQFGPSGTITLQGASQILGGTFAGSGITLGGSQTDIFQNRGGNVTVQVGTGGTIANTWTFAQNGSFTSPGNVAALGVLTDNLYYANGTPWDLQEAAGSNTQIQYNNGVNNNFGASANFTFNDSTNVLTVSGTANVTTANVSGQVNLGNSSVNTGISWASTTTTAITANQTIASFSTTGITGVEFLVKAVDSTGSKYSVATVQAVTDGTAVDYSTFGTVNLGGYTGSLAVNIVGGQIRLQVTPASSNSTVWTTQYRLI